MTLTLLLANAGLATVSKTLTSTYDVRQLGTKTLAPSYDIRNEADKELTPTYNILQLATKTLSPSYDVCVTKSKTLAPTFDILAFDAATITSPTSTVSWNAGSHTIQWTYPTPFAGGEFFIIIFETDAYTYHELGYVSMTPGVYSYEKTTNLSGIVNREWYARVWAKSSSGGFVTYADQTPGHIDWVEAVVSKTLTPTYDIQTTGATPVSKTITPTYDVRQLTTKTITPTYRIWNHVTSITNISVTPSGHWWRSLEQQKTVSFDVDTPCPPEGKFSVYFVHVPTNSWYWIEHLDPAPDSTHIDFDITQNMREMYSIPYLDRDYTVYVYYDKTKLNDWGMYSTGASTVNFNYMMMDQPTKYTRNGTPSWTFHLHAPVSEGLFGLWLSDVTSTWFQMFLVHAVPGQTEYVISDEQFDQLKDMQLGSVNTYLYYSYGDNDDSGTINWYDYDPLVYTGAALVDAIPKTITPTYDTRQLARRVLGSERHNMLMNSYLVDQAPTDTYPDGWYHGPWSNNNPMTISVTSGKDGRNALRVQYTPHESDVAVGGTLQQNISLNNKQFHSGEQIMVSAWIKGSVPRFMSQFRWENADGQATYSWAGLSTDPTTYGDWTRVSVAQTCPSGRDRLTSIDYYWEQIYSYSPSVDLYITQPLIERGNVLMDYFDGESSNASWDGAQYYTQSTEIVPVSYDIRQLATKTSDINYNINGLSNKTITPTYNIASLATKTVTPTYNMRQLGTKTITPTYNMRSLSNKTITPTYDICGKQTKTITPTYDINCLRNKTLTPTYNMRSLSNQVLSPAYNINMLVNKSITPMYNIRATKGIRGLVRAYGTMNIAYQESPRATASVVEEAQISSPRAEQGGAKVCQ